MSEMAPRPFLCPNLRFKVSDSDTQGGIEWLH
nr:MAG TPA: hypothetical protein [Caudoviricetes sp.]